MSQLGLTLLFHEWCIDSRKNERKSVEPLLGYGENFSSVAIAGLHISVKLLILCDKSSTLTRRARGTKVFIVCVKKAKIFSFSITLVYCTSVCIW